jgi:hypothetical protein
MRQLLPPCPLEKPNLVVYYSALLLGPSADFRPRQTQMHMNGELSASMVIYSHLRSTNFFISCQVNSVYSYMLEPDSLFFFFLLAPLYQT